MASVSNGPRPKWLSKFERPDERGRKIVIPYIFGEPLGYKEGNIIRAMQTIKEKSEGKAQFVKKTNRDVCYLTITQGNGCWYYTGDPCFAELSLGIGCENYGTILHELLHALGFQHEHQRPDRDQYVVIYWDNIIEKYKRQFCQLSSEEYRWNAEPFDYDSVMIYDSYGFTKDGRVTMTKRSGGLIYRHDELSQGDEEKLRKF